MPDQNESPVTELGGLASASRTSIYVLKLESSFFDINQATVDLASGEDRQRRDLRRDGPRGGEPRHACSTSRARARTSSTRSDRRSPATTCSASNRRPAIATASDIPIRVRVSRSGATVRARRTLLDRSSLEPDQPRSMSQEAMDALGSPLLFSALPLRVVTFSLRDQDPSKVQLLIHADVGERVHAEPADRRRLRDRRRGRPRRPESRDARRGWAR